MTRFEVDLDNLRELQRQIVLLSLRLEDAQLSDAQHVGVPSSPHVAHAVSDFVSHWSDGRKKIIRNLDVLAEQIQAARETYDATESSIVSAAAPVATSRTERA